MKNIRNKQVVKLTVKDLKKALRNVDGDTEIVLSFMLKDEGRMSVYLAEVYSNMKYDPVMKSQLFEGNIVELLNQLNKDSKKLNELHEENQTLKKQLESEHTMLDNAILLERTRMGQSALKQYKEAIE